MGVIGKIFVFILILLAAVVILFTGIHIKTTQNGVHTGTVTAIETNGIIFKTTTIYFKTDPQSSQEDVYCLIDKSLILELKSYQEQKKQITINYMDYLLTSMNECGVGSGIITGVENG